jgi:hypothetical protein
VSDDLGSDGHPLVTPHPYHSVEVVRKNGLAIVLFFIGFLLLINSETESVCEEALRLGLLT